MPDGTTYPATVAAQSFDAARRLFLFAVDQWLASAADSEHKAEEIRATISALQQKLQLMSW